MSDLIRQDISSFIGPVDTFSPVDELLDDLHPSIQLVESQDVLLSEETQSRALSKILPKRYTKTSTELRIYKPNQTAKDKRQNLMITLRNVKVFPSLCGLVSG